MKAKCIFPFVAAAMAIMALASCSIHIKKYDKNEELTTKTFNVDNFDKISISCSADVEYTISDSVSISVSTDMERLGRVDIHTADDGTLVIGEKDSKNNNIVFITHSSQYKVVISGPALNQVAIQGSGTFKCDGEMQTDVFYANVAGSGDIEMNSVKAEEIQAYILGSGDMSIKNVWATNLDVRVSGSGDVNLRANNAQIVNAAVIGSGDADIECKDCDKVEATIAGSGDIRIKGNVKSLKQNINGSGEIDTSNLKTGE